MTLQSLVPGPHGPLVLSRVAGAPATAAGSAASTKTPPSTPSSFEQSPVQTTRARGRSTSRSRAMMTGWILFIIFVQVQLQFIFAGTVAFY